MSWLLWAALAVCLVLAGCLVVEEDRDDETPEQDERTACQARHPAGRAHVTPVPFDIPDPRDGSDR